MRDEHIARTARGASAENEEPGRPAGAVAMSKGGATLKPAKVPQIDESAPSRRRGCRLPLSTPCRARGSRAPARQARLPRVEPEQWVESRLSTGAGFLPSRQPVAKR